MDGALICSHHSFQHQFYQQGESHASPAHFWHCNSVAFRRRATGRRIVDHSGCVHIEALDVPLREVFDALQANFNLRYRTNDMLDTRVTGTFNGPLRRVAARILAGYDFAIKITPQRIDVLVLRQNQPDDKPVAAATPARVMPTRSPAPVMTAAEANRYERGQGR
jgi:hypothetical protein